MMQSFQFDNQFTTHLPADPETGSERRQIENAIYSRVQPTPVSGPYLIAHSREVAQMLGLSEADITSQEFLDVFSGNQPLAGMDPHATCYGGHQFGNWAGQLGDGRAINLGEISRGDQHFMLQLKGAGATPYSRTADGLAVLRSSLREFLCSEAMFHLGVPTTRALSILGSGESVLRDMLYDGNVAYEPGAIVCRVSSSFVRFGHFQLLMARQENDLLKQFTDFVIRREFPHIQIDLNDPKDAYLTWFDEVCSRTAEMVVGWMRVGFVHGVMNTDNMSILGETIDYGPYGWLEDYDPDWTPNTTDAANRRYRFGQQAAVAQWNLMQLANAILPLVGDPKPLEEILSKFGQTYEVLWQRMMANKLGLKQYDASLNDNLIQLLTSTETDMTLFYRSLAQVDFSATNPSAFLNAAYYAQPSPEVVIQTNQWLNDYSAVLSQQGCDNDQRSTQMNAVNPKYVLRNYLAQLAIDDATEGDFDKVHNLLDILRQPYTEQPESEQLAAKRPEWARTRVGCSMLSCSS